MARKRPLVEARMAELQAEVDDFARLREAALGDLRCPACGGPSEGRRDVKAAVAARAKEADARSRLADMKFELELEGVRDPVKRFERRASHAASSGSFVASQQFTAAAEKARIAAELEEERRRAEMQRDVHGILAEIDRTIEVLPEKLRDEWIDRLVKKWRR